jgi:hypothetical protein
MKIEPYRTFILAHAHDTVYIIGQDPSSKYKVFERMDNVAFVVSIREFEDVVLIKSLCDSLGAMYKMNKTHDNTKKHLETMYLQFQSIKTSVAHL